MPLKKYDDIINLMEIKRKDDGGKGRFYIEDNGNQIGLMTYRKSGDGVITIDHTEVDSNHRGEGLGEDLVAEAVNFARENNLKIGATCPFARKLIDRTPEFQDVSEN